MSDPLDAALADEPDVLEALDRYAVDATGSPSRRQLISRIVRDWLITNGYLEDNPLGSPGDDWDKPTP